MSTTARQKRDISRLEDYLEAIYNLNKEKGFISTLDLAEKLGVKPPSVSWMVARLAEKGYVVRERYRGMTLTEQGTKAARSVIRRHAAVYEFLEMVGIDKDVAYEDAEGIEHHLHPVTISKIEGLVEFLKNNREYLQKMKEGIEDWTRGH
jgi:DtxR family transcriptional regulator, manganese transport regulator